MKKRLLSASNLVLFIICLMYLITYIDRVNLGTAGPVLKKELNISQTEFGTAIAAFAYPYALFQIFGGWMSDRLGPRLTLTICGVVWSLATILIGYVEGAISLIAVRVLLGIGEGAAFPTATRALASWLPKERRGFAQGITHAFARFGNAVASPIVAYLILLYTWRGSFIVVGLASLVWVLIWALFFRDEPRAHPMISKAEIDALPAATSLESRKRIPWRRLFLRILPVTLTDFCYGWILWLYSFWLPSFFSNQYHLKLTDSALFTAGVLFAGVVGDTVGGLVSDFIVKRTGRSSYGRTGVIVVGFLGSFACMVPILYVSDLTTIALCLSGAFFFAELIVAPIWAVPMDIAPEYSGTASGFMNFGFGVAGMISPIVIGKIIDVTHRWDYPFVVSLGFLLLGALLALFMRPDEKFNDDDGSGGKPAAAAALSKAA